jgi:hypothetical protein
MHLVFLYTPNSTGHVGSSYSWKSEENYPLPYGMASIQFFTKMNQFISIIFTSVVGFLGKKKHNDRQDFTATTERSKYKLGNSHKHDMSVSYCRTSSETRRKCMYDEQF